VDLNISVVCDGEESSGTLVMQGVAKHSQHNLRISHLTPDFKDTDIVYIHAGALLNPWDHLKDRIKESKRLHGVKWIAGIRGVMNFKRWTDAWPPTRFCDFIYDLDGISVANLEFYNLVRKLDPRLKVFLCHSGVDTDMFKPSPPPEDFCIGWAGQATGAKMWENFIRLPFPKRTSGAFIGTWRPFHEMPGFYREISVYVSTSVEEGCPVPPLEAAASGRPVVAINVGALPEWVPPECLASNWRELIPIIQRFQDDKELLERESARFRELSLKWDFKMVVKEYDRMFDYGV